MEQSDVSQEPGRVSPAIVTPPIQELCLDPEGAVRLWPAIAAQHPPFREQLTQHAEMVADTDALLGRLSEHNGTVMDLVEHGICREDEAAVLYDHLTAALANRDTVRLGLYLPFEVVPDNTWQPDSSLLAESMHRFVEQYRATWFSLLGVQDVRANFVDGDVLEDNYLKGGYERVIKAAHLVPVLIQKGICSLENVVTLRNISHDPVLRQSFDEGLAAYYHIPVAHTYEDRADDQVISENRQAWLTTVAREEQIITASKDIVDTILQGTNPLVKNDGSDTFKQIFVEGTYRALAILHAQDPSRVIEVARTYTAILHSFWDDPSVELRNRLVSTYRRLYKLGVIDGADLNTYHIDTPDLAAPFSNNLENIQPDVNRLQAIIGDIQSDSELDSILYPLVAVGGSRLKGYGEATSDIDVSIFIRPAISYDAYEAVRNRIDTLFPGYEPMEFWLAEDAGGLYVRDMPVPHLHTADSFWTHSLFDTAWIGTEDAARELQQSLLARYFYADTTPDEPHRQYYLERLEQDVLQYRLMHKGYVRHYPLQQRDPVLYNDAIDGQSVFWDSGYRYLASRLFIRHVFLPKIG